MVYLKDLNIFIRNFELNRILTNFDFFFTKILKLILYVHNFNIDLAPLVWTMNYSDSEDITKQLE